MFAAAAAAAAEPVLLEEDTEEDPRETGVEPALVGFELDSL